VNSAGGGKRKTLIGGRPQEKRGPFPPDYWGTSEGNQAPSEARKEKTKSLLSILSLETVQGSDARYFCEGRRKLTARSKRRSASSLPPNGRGGRKLCLGLTEEEEKKKQTGCASTEFRKISRRSDKEEGLAKKKKRKQKRYRNTILRQKEKDDKKERDVHRGVEPKRGREQSTSKAC